MIPLICAAVALYGNGPTGTPRIVIVNEPPEIVPPGVTVCTSGVVATIVGADRAVMESHFD